VRRLEANLAAIEVVKALQADGRSATPAEQEILARWSGWGAVAAVFEDKPGQSPTLTEGRQQLRTLLTDTEYAAARRNTINAHYTGTALAQAMWDGLAAFGFAGGRVLEPGCGAGTFIGLAPLGTAMVGIELDPVTAQVAAALYPHADIRSEDFAASTLMEGTFDAVIGNVPFGKIHMADPRYNRGRKDPIHTHFLLKSAALVRPGGWVALITSRHTLDGTGADAVAARRKLAGLGELVAAVRLPSSAHRRAAGTDVVTDVLVIRRFGDGEQPPPEEPAWIQTAVMDAGGVQIPVNRYFADHPAMMLGDLAAGGARGAAELRVTAPADADVASGLAQALTRAAGAHATAVRRAPAATPVPGPEGFQQARPDGTFTRITSGAAEPFGPPGGTAGQAELRALLGLRDTALALLDAELATSEDAGPVDELRTDLNTRYDAYLATYGPVNRHTRQVRIKDTTVGRALRERLLADGHARVIGGRTVISDPAVRDRLAAAGQVTVSQAGDLRFGRSRVARAHRQQLLDTGLAQVQGGTVTLTPAGRDWVLANAADLGEAVAVGRVRPGQGGFRNDPFAVRVLALERYDPETGTTRKNDIMRHRVLLPRPAATHADDPKDALAICLDRHAQVRLDVIAGLLGAASEQDARDRLGTLVFHDPAGGRLVAAPAYLSGDVREKLRQATEAAAGDPSYQVNVEALTRVIPPDLGPAEIEARLGAVFITPGEVQQFLRETLTDPAVTVTRDADGTWSVTGGDRHCVAATLTWGTKDRDALALTAHILNRKGPVEVTRKDADGETWTDQEATAAAREKQAELSDRFAGWVWEDLDRAIEVCRRYNEAFNAIVLRSYDDVQLSLPGVNQDIKPFWWQKAAIARMIYEPTAGLFHDMGAGKTLEQIIGVMEQKRLALIRKPVICVKNHLLDQFRDEFLWAYPQARVLCAGTDDLQGEGRRQFIARCAAENPDAIIMTRGAFESIPLTPEGHEAYLGYMKAMFSVHAEAVTDSVKDEETLLAEFEQRLRAYFDPDAQQDEEDEPDRKRGKRKIEQDPAVCWEQMGIDYICVDESQDYNNLWVPSEEPGMGIAFVHRAIDLEMKLHATRRRYGNRVCTLATGTPVTNKIPQFYVLQRYLRPERLQKTGFAGYAPWAATYTEPEQRLEMKADGGFGLVTRMRLINFPELLLDLHYFGDFKDGDDIGMKRPAIRGGKPEIRGVPAVPELTDYQATLPARYNEAKGGKKQKGDDTVVAVLGDGFRAAQDLRLVKAKHGDPPQLTDDPQKIDHLAEDIHAEWLAHRDDIYPGEDGQPDPVPGSLQLVFCNEGVPKAEHWNLYDELRTLLIGRGLPRAAIRFIHDAATARKKAELFAACNAGHVGVLIGSTEKMGVGTNVQRRAIGVHHVHPHWRPDYDAQEDARVRRPGNLNPEVFIKKWITEGSFDTIRAQACERKSVWLRIIKHRDTSVRSIEAPDDDTHSYAEVAAVGAGEPRLIHKAQLESELQQLARAQRRHANNQNALKVAAQQARAAITTAGQVIRDIDTAASRIIPTAGDAFQMTVDGSVFTSRREAGDHLITHLLSARARLLAGTSETRAAGTLGGFQLIAALAHDGREDDIVLRLEHLPQGTVRLNHRELPSGLGLVTRLEKRLGGLGKLRAEQQAIIDRQQQEITRAQSAIGTPFPQQDALLATQKTLDELVTELQDKDGKKTGPGTASVPASTQGDDHEDLRPEAVSTPSGSRSPSSSQTSQAPGRTGNPASAPAATQQTSDGTPADPSGEHPLAAEISSIPETAQASSASAQPATASPGSGTIPAGSQPARQSSTEPVPVQATPSQGHPVREPARTANGQCDQDQPGTGATAETASRPGHADPEPPVAAGNTAGLSQLAAAHGLAAETVKTGRTLMTTVHDDGRTVLLHDDISGARAGGQRLDPGEVPAYLAAYARHPQLPPRCLADLARHDPGEPAPLALTPARETAAQHGLEVHIRRVGSQSYITFCEPGTGSTPILSYPAGSASAHHGPCAVPVTVIGSYLAAYRESVPAGMFTVPDPRDWGRRVALLTPHLVDGSSHFIPATRDRLRAALAAARHDDIAEARTLLAEAEEMTPVSLAPERQAELTAAIRRHTVRYGHAEDPAACLATASPRVLDVSERELHWVRAYIADHPEVREHPETIEPAAGPGSDREAAAHIGQQAKEALDSGDHQRALALLDEAELRYPSPAIHWDAARDQVRAAMSTAAPGNPQDSQRPHAQAPEAGDRAGVGTAVAATSPAADTPPAGPVSRTGTEESTAAPTAAGPEPGTGGPDAGRSRAGRTATEPAPAGYYEARAAGHPWESVTWVATPEGRASAEAHARSHSARSDSLWEVRHVPGGPDAAPTVIARYRLGFLQLNDTTFQPATGQAAAAEAALGTLARPPEGTQPLAGHAGWAGNLRPERLLYADGTPLTIRGQGEDNDQALPATAVGVIPAPADSDHGPGRLQVVRWDDGRYETVHPALASPRGTDPYDGLGDRDRARCAAFDLAETWPTTTAGLLPHLVNPGDVVEVERGLRSHTVDLREVRSVKRGTGPYAGGLEFRIHRSKTTLYYPDNRLVPVCIPKAHPALAAAIRAALPAGPGQPETALPPVGQTATDAPDTAAPPPRAAGSPAEPSGPAESDQPGRYSARIRISLESGPPTVSGTSYDDPAELREALRASFTWRKKRQLWEYTGRSTGLLEAVESIRDVLARLDRKPATPTGKEFPPTPQQQAILDAFLDGKTIAVQALAGTGKTTTLVLLARALMDRSPAARIIYTAFNADIVADARRGRFGRNVTASTMHSIAKQALLQTSYAAKIEHGDQGARWPEQWADVLGIPEITAPTGEPVAAGTIARMVLATVRKFRESADSEPGRQHLPAAANGPLAKTVLPYARQAWADISNPGNAPLLSTGRALRVDHDDYLKVWALSKPALNAGVIFFDEAQDVNAVMRSVIVGQQAQTVVVGDSHQSIYSFRGAIDALKDWPADLVLPLTQSWRFGPDAAEFGNLFLRSLGSRLLLEGNPALKTRLGSAAEPDAILCRTNATAVSEVSAGLDSGKRVALAGGGQAIREIAKAARDLQTGRGTKHPDLARFTDWDEVRRYAENEEDGKSLQMLVRLVDRHGPDGLIDMISRLTPEADTKHPPQLTISTVHKAKGRQWPAVRIAGDFRGPVTDPATGEITWPSPEERRLAYVAATRAQQLIEIGSLHWIYDHPQARLPRQGTARQHTVPTPHPPPESTAPETAVPGATAQSRPDPSPGAGRNPAPGSAPPKDAITASPAAAVNRTPQPGTDDNHTPHGHTIPEPASTSTEAAGQPGGSLDRPSRPAAVPPGSPVISPEPAGQNAAPPAAPAQSGAPGSALASGPQVQGYAAYMAELRARASGDTDVSDRLSRWGLAIAHASGQTPGCQPTVLTAHLGDSLDLRYRGACRGCDWEGEIRPRENPATEDAHDHAFPGWRDLPAVEQIPRTPKARERWMREVTSMYPPGWLERGGPVRTLRKPGLTRHHPMNTAGLTGYDIAAQTATPAGPAPAAAAPRQDALPAQPLAAPGPAAAADRSLPADRSPAASQPPAAAPKPSGGGMRFMNDMDIEQAVQRWQDHPVLGPASRTLASIEAWADASSDGWATWPLPARAANRLMTLIERDGTYQYQADTVRADATPAALRAAYTPLKSFRTRHNADFTIEEAAPARPSRRSTPVQDTAAAQPQQPAAVPVTSTHPEPGQPAALPGPEPDESPVTSLDLERALHRLAGWQFTQIITQPGQPQNTGSVISRPVGEPDAGASEQLNWNASGVEITIRSPRASRHGHLTWPQIASWIDAGMTPGRFGIIVTATQLHSYCHSHRNQLIAARKCDPDAAATELAHIQDGAISTVITAARRSRGAAAPVPPARPGQPACHPAAMITRPDLAASKKENTTLARLAELRAAIHGPQPISAADARTVVRRWIDDMLPDHVRALGAPARMRAWIDGQITTRANQPAYGTYDIPGIPGARWYGASPEGLLTCRSDDDRAETLIAWEEIPAWIQPGLTTSLRDRLLSADDIHRSLARRTLTAAAHPPAGTIAPSNQETEDAARLRREAIAAAWTAIEAAPPPSAADLEHARHTYRNAGHRQHTLFDRLAPDHQQDDRHNTASTPDAAARRSAPAVHSQVTPPGNTASGHAAAKAHSTRIAPAQPGLPITAAPATAGGNRRHQQPPAPAQSQPASTGAPLTAEDISLGLSRLPAHVFAGLIDLMDSGQPVDSLSRQLAPHSGTRTADEPDTGAAETVGTTPAGVRIQIHAASGTRTGLLSWPEVMQRLRPGLTPLRRQLLRRTTEASLRFAIANMSFRAVGESDLAASAEQELRALASAAAAAILGATGPGALDLDDQPAPAARHEADALERITALEATLPAQPPHSTPLAGVRAGDIIGHPGYKLQPFQVTGPAQQAGDQVEITGYLTQPANGEPTGQITITLPTTGEQDPFVTAIPAPAQSLRTLDPSQPTMGNTARPARPPGSGHGTPPAQAPPTPSRPRAHTPTAGTAGTGSTAPQAATASSGTLASSGVKTAGPAPITATPAQENSMPPAPTPPTASTATVDPASAASPPTGAPSTGSSVHPPASPAVQADDETRLLGQLDQVLAAIIEHRRDAARRPRTSDEFTGIRTAFTLLRNALAPAPATGQHFPAAGQEPAQPKHTAPASAQVGPDPGDARFDDIREAFADLRHVLGLPPAGQLAGSTPAHATAPPSRAAGELLDDAAAEAQACARWYRDTPEWQRITQIGRAARELTGAIRDAAGDYWAEIRQDIRVRGFAHTITARICRAVSGTAHTLASRLEHAGLQNTRIWQAASGLHQATRTFADTIMKYAPPQDPARMQAARQIIDSLGDSQATPGEPVNPPASSTGHRPPRTPSPVTLANASFPAAASQPATPRHAPARRTTAPGRQQRAAHLS
jgi:N12 class adenine-specific DNA methylase/superfamily I DNA/RNA helicase